MQGVATDGHHVAGLCDCLHLVGDGVIARRVGLGLGCWWFLEQRGELVVRPADTRQVYAVRFEPRDHFAQRLIIPVGNLAEPVVGKRQRPRLGGVEVDEPHRHLVEPEQLGSLEPGMARDEYSIGRARDERRGEAEALDRIGDGLDRCLVSSGIIGHGED